MQFGIMQGRLTFTKNNILQKLPTNWQKEYENLSAVRLDYIEIFTTKYRDKSPIWKSNPKLLQKKILSTNLKKLILCDNFILESNVLEDKYMKYFNLLIKKVKLFNNSLLVIPLDKILFNNSHYSLVVKKIISLIKICKKNNTEISFEVDISLSRILKLIKDVNSKDFKITFDTGNIFLLKNNNAYLLNYFMKIKNRVNHIHIKDRNIFGANVILGSGLVNFRMFCNAIKKIKYNKTLTFETHRGKNPIKTAKNNISFIKNYL
jgi:sugar phosphate isomerase/epimerase